MDCGNFKKEHIHRNNFGKEPMDVWGNGKPDRRTKGNEHNKHNSEGGKNISK